MTHYRIWSHQIGNTFYYRTRSKAITKLNELMNELEDAGVNDYVLTLDSIDGQLIDNFDEDSQKVIA